MPENNDELKPMDDVLEVSPTLRGRVWEIVFAIVLSLFFLKLYKMVPANGVFFDELINMKMSFLHFKIKAAYLQNPLRILCLGSIAYGAFVYLQQKMTKYRLTHLYIQKQSGILFRVNDSTDLTTIKDQTLTRNPIELILGLSKLTILSNDATHPEMTMKGITKSDAEKVVNFLRKYAFRSYTEYRISRDREKSRSRNPKDRGFVDDGDFE